MPPEHRQGSKDDRNPFLRILQGRRKALCDLRRGLRFHFSHQCRQSIAKARKTVGIRFLRILQGRRKALGPSCDLRRSLRFHFSRQCRQSTAKARKTVGIPFLRILQGRRKALGTSSCDLRRSLRFHFSRQCRQSTAKARKTVGIRFLRILQGSGKARAPRLAISAAACGSILATSAARASPRLETRSESVSCESSKAAARTLCDLRRSLRFHSSRQRRQCIAKAPKPVGIRFLRILQGRGKALCDLGRSLRFLLPPVPQALPRLESRSESVSCGSSKAAARPFAISAAACGSILAPAPPAHGQVSKADRNRFPADSPWPRHRR